MCSQVAPGGPSLLLCSARPGVSRRRWQAHAVTAPLRLFRHESLCNGMFILLLQHSSS
uniref:Uncharacterized protein n=1 Tax=Zea mays TaxID=4577 RepID=B6SH11_MAIZE|nr:hypothetical protein [Zea mays]|eukprot:NP_001338565.1 uncharacterized protein LOC100274660 [Zea mays]